MTSEDVRCERGDLLSSDQPASAAQHKKNKTGGKLGLTLDRDRSGRQAHRIQVSLRLPKCNRLFRHSSAFSTMRSSLRTDGLAAQSQLRNTHRDPSQLAMPVRSPALSLRPICAPRVELCVLWHRCKQLQQGQRIQVCQ